MYNSGYPSYGQPSPHYPPQQGQAYAPQPSQHVNPALAVATDPNAFAQMFKSHLAALTFNSKPLITNLTVISHEHAARMSAVVAQCLDEHILSVSGICFLTERFLTVIAPFLFVCVYNLEPTWLSPPCFLCCGFHL